MKSAIYELELLRVSSILSRVTPILPRVSLGVGANSLAFYDGRHYRPIFARAIKTPKPEKPRKSGFFA